MTQRRRLAVVVSFRTAGLRSARFMTGSIAVHGTLLAAVLIVPATRHRATPIDDAMVVALAGPIAESVAPRGAVSAAPTVKPAPAPPPPPKEAHTVREVPIAKPKPKDKPVKPKPEPDAPPESEAKETPPQTPPTGPRDAKPGEGSGQPSGQPSGALTATVGGGDSALGWYGAAVKAALESAWIKPYLEDAQGTASVVVTFDIARDGASRNIRIQQSSGIPSLDRSAQRAVIEASPFPAPPPTWTEDTIPVTMRFDLSAEPR